jgi:hypothetical protein
VKHRHIFGEMRRRVAFGIDGDEQRLDLVTGFSELVYGEADFLQVGRTNIRAIGKAEVRPGRNEFTPAESQTFVRYRPAK